MSAIKLSTPSSGSISLSPANTASNLTITVPAVSGTMATSTTPTFTTTIGVGGATPAASGAGITFPATQSASSDANTLDDYEEGTWTPNAFNNGSSSTWTVKYGKYIKVGNLVTCWWNLDGGNSGTAGGAIILTNLPFALGSNSNWQNWGTVNTNATGGESVMANTAGTSAQIWVTGGAQDLNQRTYMSGVMSYTV